MNRTLRPAIQIWH